jgi:hypothetical protein
MPENADVIVIQPFSNDTCAIVDFVTERTRPKLQQAKSDCNQPTRGSTLELQCLRAGFAVLLPQRYALGLGNPI